MIEILEDELKVLRCLVHEETLETIIAETGLQPKVARDIVRTLWHYRYLTAVTAEGKQLMMADADKLFVTRFRLTAKGFGELGLKT